MIRLPEDKRPKLLRRASFDLLRFKEAVVAAEFVFTAIGIGYSTLICSTTFMSPVIALMRSGHGLYFGKFKLKYFFI
jgi:hypothetical protein